MNNIPKWKLIEKHETEIRKVLIETKCMDGLNRIRSWKVDTWDKLGKAGHNSLDFNKCKCRAN